jgi:hypothetical protein
MQPVPSRFLVRLARKCLNHPNVPLAKGDALLDLSSEFTIASLCGLDGQEEFAELRICWNTQGLGFQATITGKKQPPEGDNTRPRSSDGITIWIDTRDSRSSHRATRYCHQFHFLASGAGPDREDPCFVQSKIHRALQDAPFCNPSEIMFRCTNEPSGYFMEAFLPSQALAGYDSEECPRLGVCIQVHDRELGDQIYDSTLDFPFSEDPSLWSQLILVHPDRDEKSAKKKVGKSSSRKADKPSKKELES